MVHGSRCSSGHILEKVTWELKSYYKEPADNLVLYKKLFSCLVLFSLKKR